MPRRASKPPPATKPAARLRAEGDGSRFELAESAFASAPSIHQLRLYLETMEQVLPGKKKLIVDSVEQGAVIYCCSKMAWKWRLQAAWAWRRKRRRDSLHAPYKNSLPLGAAAVFAAVFAWLTFFSVRETEFALITQFGRPVDTITERGPARQVVLPERLPTSTGACASMIRRPSEFLTRDKKNLVIESYVAWRITRSAAFRGNGRRSGSAEMRLHDIVWSGLSAVLGTTIWMPLWRPTPARYRPMAFLDQLTAATGASALSQYGIEIVDVRIKRLNLPEQNKQSVYARMRAERERIARQYRAEGEEQALRIRADADRQRDEISIGGL